MVLQPGKARVRMKTANELAMLGAAQYRPSLLMLVLMQGQVLAVANR